MRELTDDYIKYIFEQRTNEWEEILLRFPEADEKEINRLHSIFIEECREIAKQKIEEEEEFFSLDYDEIEANYNKSYFDTKKIVNIEKQAIEEKRESIKFDYIAHMTKCSFMNELPIEISFHSVLSVFLKDIPLTMDNRKIMSKIHMFWTQASGSGKGELFNEIGRLFDTYNKKYESEYIVNFLDGSETLESMYNHYEIGKNGKVDITKPIDGLFQKSDIIILEEASYLFSEKKATKQTKAETLLKALEDKPMMKLLASWNGNATITNPEFVLFASTREVNELNGNIASSGLLQRPLCCFRVIDSDTRKKMDQRLIYNRVMEGISDEERELGRSKVSSGFKFIRQNLINNKDKRIFEFENLEDAYQFLSKIIMDMKEYLYDNIRRIEHKQVCEAFIARYTDKLVTLSIHNAIIRNSNKINLIDIENAGELIKKAYINMCFWIEKTIEESRISRKRRVLLDKYIDMWFEAKHKYKHDELLDLIEEFTKFSRNYARNLIESNLIGEKALFKIEVENDIKYVYKNSKRK